MKKIITCLVLAISLAASTASTISCAYAEPPRADAGFYIPDSVSETMRGIMQMIIGHLEELDCLNSVPCWRDLDDYIFRHYGVGQDLSFDELIHFYLAGAIRQDWLAFLLARESWVEVENERPHYQLFAKRADVFNDGVDRIVFGEIDSAHAASSISFTHIFSTGLVHQHIYDEWLTIIDEHLMTIDTAHPFRVVRYNDTNFLVSAGRDLVFIPREDSLGSHMEHVPNFQIIYLNHDSIEAVKITPDEVIVTRAIASIRVNRNKRHYFPNITEFADSLYTWEIWSWDYDEYEE